MSEQFSLQATAAVDSGFGAIVMLLRYHGIGTDPGWIRPRFLGIAECGAAAKSLAFGYTSLRPTRRGSLLPRFSMPISPSTIGRSA
jgi:hypothetical protein